MPKEKAKKSHIPKRRLFPIVLVMGASIFIYILNYYRSGSPLLSSLGNLAFTMLLFLILITLVDCLNRSGFWEKGKKIVNKVLKKNINRETKKNDDFEEPCDQQDEQQDDLIEIKKENVSQAHNAGASLEKRVYAALYIIASLGIAIWRVIGILKIKPWSYVERYRGSIVDAVLLLVFPCICILYLKMRTEGACPSDKITRDILIFFSYTSFVYAAVIAATAVLKINFLIVLQWVYYAASLYLIIALAINIALAYLQGNILSFNYTLFPKKFASLQAAQWKVSLKSLYTIRYTLGILPALALALLFILLLSTMIFVVQPHQQAAVYHFGKLNPSSIKNEGLHFKFPWPIDKAEIYDVHRVSSMQVGYESSGSGNFLWGQAHDGGEYMLLLGNGNEMAAVNLKIMYVISDLYAYIKTCTNPQAVLSAAAYNALMSRTVNTTLDSFLNVDRNSLSESVLNELSLFCESEKLGLSVNQIIVESIHPPVDLANVYQNVVSASVDKTTAITRAESYAQAKVIEAAKQSKSAIDGARAMQHGKVSDAQKEATVLYAATEAYRIAGGSFELSKQLDVYEKIIKSNKVYVFSPGAESGISNLIIGKVNTVNLVDVQGEGL